MKVVLGLAETSLAAVNNQIPKAATGMNVAGAGVEAEVTLLLSWDRGTAEYQDLRCSGVAEHSRIFAVDTWGLSVSGPVHLDADDFPWETQACEDPQGSHSEAQVQQRLVDFRGPGEESRISLVEPAEDCHWIEWAALAAKEPEAWKRRVGSR